MFTIHPLCFEHGDIRLLSDRYSPGPWHLAPFLPPTWVGLEKRGRPVGTVLNLNPRLSWNTNRLPSPVPTSPTSHLWSLPTRCAVLVPLADGFRAF
ncbi:hypothetical protein VTK73DRAFT_5803 [Phialemonium thermophilum]|uniref:Uncharacterized protein n=1 Tax=Phialemonium thermophilum TaxID=223376 RepID=A0ABR3WLK9_9PEZI